jgi:dephospho-CoA kinase
MLEHLGAYGIDADTLSHRAIARGAPAYQSVVETFGRWILNPDGEIDRNRLGKVVFSDPEAMAQLEKLVHPLVTQAIDLMIKRSVQPVIVIEAIKLLESDLRKQVDGIWVVYVPPEVQLFRLMQNRKMSEADAKNRVTMQPPQEDKMKVASVIIRNNSSFESTWQQVVAAWKKNIPTGEPAIAPTTAPVAQGEVTVLRGKPRNAGEIAGVINRIQKAKPALTKDDIMAAFGEKAFLLLQVGDAYMGVIGWQVENLVTRTTDIVLDPTVPLDKALPALISEMERASRDLQCEASLIFAPPFLARQDHIWKSLGYEKRKPQTLGVLAWQEAAQETMPPETELYFKQLRQDRILRPI